MPQDIPLLDLNAQHVPLADAIQAAMAQVVTQGAFIMGPDVALFESEVAAYLGASHAISVSSGTDALLVALMALDIKPGDEVITSPFSFFATAGAVARLGATPVFVDIDPHTFNLDVSKVEAAITPRTRAIIPVHLFGQACDVAAIKLLLDSRHIAVIEDAAQAIGARAHSGRVGCLGALGCFSFFPSKNLGCFGDGGLVTTEDAALAERVKRLRVHGSHPKYYHSLIGGNFRMDTLQAAVLRVKLPLLDKWTQMRIDNARIYDTFFGQSKLSTDRLITPSCTQPHHVFNQYVIRTSKRDSLAKHLKDEGVQTAIYYPVPLHLQECFSSLGYRVGSLPEAERACQQVLALPVYPGLSTEQLEQVAQSVVDHLSA